VTDVEIALPAQSTLGRGPSWDGVTDTLLWVDAAGTAAHRFWPATGGDEQIELPQPAGAARPRSNGGLVVNLRDGVGLRDPDGTMRWLVYWERPGFGGAEAAVDPSGRFWAGTVKTDATGGGWLARVEPTGRAKVMLDDERRGAGLAWSPDATAMYWVNAPGGRIEVFDFDDAEGTATGRRELCAVDGGEPGGLCVDADGCVWVAVRDAGQIRRYTPDGTLDRTLELPVRAVTGCCFGGLALDDLYVTTDGTTGAADDPDAGALLVVRGAGLGLPVTRFTG
jgi:sugar lactone lactonase YvrE